MATGWLGWTPEQALHTPIPQIELALDGRVEWVRKTSPFGSQEAEESAPVADRLRAAFSSRKPDDLDGPDCS